MTGSTNGSARTADGDSGTDRTSAATAARKASAARARLERQCREMVERLPELDGQMLTALFECVLDEIAQRADERVRQAKAERLDLIT